MRGSSLLTVLSSVLLTTLNYQDSVENGDFLLADEEKDRWVSLLLRSQPHWQHVYPVAVEQTEDSSDDD